jgi:formamidopyrimidine-DNA glycosylase
MPELPEVEIITQHLSKSLINDEIIGLDVKFEKLLKNIDSNSLQNKLIPFYFSKIIRKGKYIVFEDYSNNKWFTTHLGMTGAFFIVDNINEIPFKYKNHQHLLFNLKSNRLLVYCDIRKFGDIRYFDKDPYEIYEPFIKMGSDPLLVEQSNEFILKLSSKLFSHKEIKPSILDSRLIAGVGNIYACEALFGIGIHPKRLCSELTPEESKKLYQEIRSIFILSIKNGGSSVSDYVNIEGQKGQFQNFHKVYQKNVCFTCQSNVLKIDQNKRSTFFCPTCQH